MSNFQKKDVRIGQKLMFKRTGVPDFDLYWTVVGFHEEMVEVEIVEMGKDEKLFIDYGDIIKLV